MKVIVNGTKKILSIVDPESGSDYITDFIGNSGAMTDGQFVWDDDLDAYICDRDTYNWWRSVIDDNQELDHRIAELKMEHGSEAVFNAIDAAGSVDLEDHAANLNQALDKAFGAQQ